MFISYYDHFWDSPRYASGLCWYGQVTLVHSSSVAEYCLILMLFECLIGFIWPSLEASLPSTTRPQELAARRKALQIPGDCSPTHNLGPSTY